MKILHTSDWHIGQSFHDHERTYEHEAFFAWLIDTMESQQVDALLVSGDIYDTANPSSESQKMLAKFIAAAKLRCPKLQMIITGGNHDSGQRLEAPGELAKAFDSVLMGNLPKKLTDQNTLTIDWSQVVLPLKNRDQTIETWCGAVPFIRPEEWSLYRKQAQELYGTQSYAACVKALYADMNAYLLTACQPGQKKIAMGHLHLASGELSDTERKFVIGGEDVVEDTFLAEAFDYVALGHLHKAQKVGKDTVRYCGSPIPLSFAERNYKHQVVLWDTTDLSLEILHVPRAVDIAVIPAKHAYKAEVLRALQTWEPAQQGLPQEQWPYLLVQVLIDKPDPDLMDEIDQALKDKPLRRCRVDLKIPESQNASAELLIKASAGLQELKPEHVFDDFYRRKNQTEPTPEIQQAFAEIAAIAIHSQGVQA
jgi:exonuclease SbcD